jgi:acetyl-CoA carboxylase biotin carboxyl carrier protein
MDLDEIKKLIELVRNSGIGELEVQRGDNRVRVRSASPAGQEIVVSAAPAAASGITAPPASAMSPSEEHAQLAAKESEQDIVVKSPIVGTYYDAPSEGAPPFVKNGDLVKPNHVICIIESMKLMNEIEAEVAGVVIAKHVENGRPVEYGESLVTIRPA